MIFSTFRTKIKLILKKPKLLNYFSDINLSFLFLCIILLVLPIIPFFEGKVHNEYFIIATGIWGMYTFFKINRISFDFLDGLVLLFTLYESYHFFIFSDGTVMSIFVWQRLSFVVLYFVLKSNLNNQGEYFLSRLVYVLILMVVLEVMLSILQFMEVLPSRSLYFLVAGSFTTPNFLAYILVLGIILCVWFRIKNTKVSSITNRSIAIVIIGLVILLVYTKSRTAFIGLIVSLSFLFIRKRGFQINKVNIKTKIIASIVAVTFFISAAFLLYNFKKDSADGRLLIAKITSKKILDNPLLGHGLFSFTKGYNLAKADYFSEKQRSYDEIKIADFAYSALNDY